ncbi:MAG TPA: hemolysin family protein [Ilumatobacteraceae bacterium]|jgi:CBS domain containing-hemolysin-like protein|nr:hemolysin family protein [Ilumatobacteraceae bacterium]
MVAVTGGIEVSWLALGLAVVLLALNGFFVAAEFALLASRRSRLEQLAAEGDRRARHALAGLRELTIMLAGAQLGITMCSLGLGAVAEPAVARIIESALGEWFTLSDTASHVIAVTIALSVVVFLHMVVAEMAPKSWAIAHPEKSSLLLARPFRLFALVFRPVILLLNGLANGVVRLVGVEPQDERAMAHSPSDLLLLIEESAGRGGIAAEEHELLARSLELSGLTAADAMTPRRDIVAVAATATATELAQEAHRTGRTRVIVHEEDLDHVRGFVHAKDVIRLEQGTWQTTTVGPMARPIMVTPEHHGLEDLLLEMRTQRHHIALVVDEHGLVLGLVTLEDVIEELIGDFDDESDRRLGDCEHLPDGSFRMSGTTRVEAFAECTGVALPDGDWQTVAGYVIDALDEIPSVGDRVRTAIGEFEVLAMDGYAIDSLRIRIAVSGPVVD